MNCCFETTSNSKHFQTALVKCSYNPLHCCQFWQAVILGISSFFVFANNHTVLWLETTKVFFYSFSCLQHGAAFSYEHFLNLLWKRPHSGMWRLASHVPAAA